MLVNFGKRIAYFGSAVREEPSMIPAQYAWLWLIPILLIVMWLGARSLNTDAIWFDEYYSVYNAGGSTYGPVSLAETWQRVVQTEWNPPGYFLLLNAWGRLVGWTPYAARALSLFAGVAAVAWVYRLGREMFSWQVGLSAAVVLAASAFYLHYLHEMRQYTLTTLLILIYVWCYWRILDRKGSTAFRLGLVISAAALLYSFYLAALALAAMGLYHLLFVPRTRLWWRVWVLLAISGIMLLPWVGTVLQEITQMQGTLRHTVALDAPTALQMLVYAFSNASVALLALVGGYGLLARGRAAAFLKFWLGGVLVLTLASNEWLKYLHVVRYLLMLWPALALLVGVGVVRLQNRGIKPLWVLAVWCAAGLWNLSDPAFFSSLRTVKPLPFNVLNTVLMQRAQPGDVVAFDAPDFNWNQTPVLEYYTNRLPVRQKVIEDLPGKEGETEFYDSARQFMGGAPHVWFGVETDLPPNFRRAEFQRALAVDYASCGTVLDLPDMRFDLYAHVPTTPALIHFGKDVSLWTLEPLPAKADKTLTVLLGWSTSGDIPPDTYQVGLHVENASHQLVTQTDIALPLGNFSCQSATIAVDNLPSGDYHLLAAVYAWKTGERLPGSFGGSANPDSRVLLGSFRIGK
jgi:hypothetical protein